jgi:LytS/YehU family sensor histidine kinase
MHLRPGENWQFLRATLLSLPALILSTYVVAWYVVPRFLQNNNWGLFAFWILLIGVFVFFARLEWQQIVNYLNYGVDDRVPASKMLKNIIRDYSIIALAVCVSIIADYRKKQLINEQLIRSKAEAEIKLLKGQLHPHFLFNSLNNIYGLALTKSDRTADSILKLTELLDYLIYRASLEKVPLSEEVELLENYIGLEQLRYDQRLQIEADLKVDTPNQSVAPLILLPFAENCFKHGGPGREGVFMVKVYLSANAKELVFHLSNSKKDTKISSEGSGGIGLRNIQQRLNLLYPGKHRLILDDKKHFFTVVLQITF